MTHIYVRTLTIIVSDNGLLPGRRQAIIWTNAGILSIGPLGTNFSKVFIGIYIFSFTKMHLKISSGNWRLFCLGLNVLTVGGGGGGGGGAKLCTRGCLISESLIRGSSWSGQICHCSHPILVLSRQPSRTRTRTRTRHVNAHTNTSYSDMDVSNRYNNDPVARLPHPVRPPAETVTGSVTDNPRVDSGDYSLVDDR